MKHLRLFLSVPVVSALLLAASGGGVAAQVSPSLSVYPEKFEFPVSRGEMRREELRIVNRGSTPLPLHLRTVRWDARDEVGNINFSDTPEDPSFDITQWITLPERDLIVEPGETVRLPVTIAVPENAEPGGKYGAILIESALPGFFFTEGASRVLPEIAVLFLLNVPLVELEGTPVAPAAAIAEFRVEGASPTLSAIASRIATAFRAPASVFAREPAVSVEVLSRSLPGLTLRIRNNAGTHIRPYGSITVHNMFGGEVVRLDVPPTTILPGKIRRFPLTLPEREHRFLPEAIARELAFGRYTATLVLSGVGEEPLVEKLSYWVFPWQALLVALAMLLPLGYGAFRFRDRLALAFRTLISRKPPVKTVAPPSA